MSDHGLIVIDKGLLGHHRFADQPLTEREAFVWMIGQAAFRPYCRRVGRVRVELKRGQLAHSTRWMAEQWKWSEAGVRRYLGKLATKIGDDDAMVTLSTDAGVTVVTICNYSAYQDALKHRDALEQAEFDADLTPSRRKEESIAKDVVVDGERPTPSKSKPAWIDEDLDVAREALKAMGDEPEGPRQITMAYQAAMWRERGIPRAEILATFAEISDKAEKFTLSYYIAAVNARGRRNRERPPPADQPHLPLSPVVISSTERTHGQTPANPPAATWQQSRDAFRVARAKLSAYVEAADADGISSGDGGGPPVQIAATAGRG